MFALFHPELSQQKPSLRGCPLNAQLQEALLLQEHDQVFLKILRLFLQLAKIHSGHLPGAWAINRITAAIAEGPAINGTANGTTRGSSFSSWVTI